MLYIVLFILYFCLFSCLFHSAESHQISENISTTIINEQPDFYDQVQILMTDDIQPSPIQETPPSENITTPAPLSHKDLMQVPFDIIKAIASEMNLQLTGNKSQLCSRLKHYDIRPEHISKFQLAQ